ncbi:MAG: class I tRNA ligase family protein, partial [Patescibacteria group bacterium]
LMGKGHAYKNVVCLGHILDAKGKKMSKSIGNVIDPWVTMEKFGADAVRYWMYSVNQPGESKNFDEKTVDEGIKKVFNLTLNVLAFYKLYEGKELSNEATKQLRELQKQPESANVLDKWILARLNQTIAIVTNSLDSYKFFEPTRAIRDFVGDLSQWYLRRSRDRFKDDAQRGVPTEAVSDKEAALATTRYVLVELSKLLAPFTPFLAEHLYREVNGAKESVHLEDWTLAGNIDVDLIADMADTREMASRGLEARTNAKINVRQPLAALKVKTGRWTLRQKALGSAYVSIIRDEVNVKEVKFGPLDTDVELDTVLTPELKEEGELRELMRKVQDMRKEKGLAVGDLAVLVVGEAEKELANKYADQLKKVTSLSGIESGESLQLKA